MFSTFPLADVNKALAESLLEEGFEREPVKGVHVPKRAREGGVDIYLPTDESSQVVEDISALSIEEIFDRCVNVDAVRIIDNHKKRMIPRFRCDREHFNWF